MQKQTGYSSLRCCHGQGCIAWRWALITDIWCLLSSLSWHWICFCMSNLIWFFLFCLEPFLLYFVLKKDIPLTLVEEISHKHTLVLFNSMTKSVLLYLLSPFNARIYVCVFMFVIQAILFAFKCLQVVLS
jgi:hypothetical protein